MAQPALVLVLAYLLGSIPTGLWISRALGTADLRTRGSGSAGATNVLRFHGWAAALPVALLDGAKGWIAAALLPGLGESATGFADWLPAAAGFAAALGHVWPALARFRGGKGVATAAGAALAIRPLAAAAAVGLFVVAVLATRRVSAGSLAAAAVLPALFYLLEPSRGSAPVAFGIALLALILWTHRRNVANLLAGTEPRIGR